MLHGIAHHPENVAKRFLKFVERWLESDFLGDHDDVHFKAASYGLCEEIQKRQYETVWLPLPTNRLPAVSFACITFSFAQKKLLPTARLPT